MFLNSGFYAEGNRVNTLQNIIFPDYNPTVPDDMYIRCVGESFFFREEKKVVFEKYGKSILDTYFNAFMLDAWCGRAKITSLSLRLRGEGKFRVRVFLNRFASAGRVVSEKTLALDKQGISIVLDEVLQWQDGMVFFEIMALENNASFLGGEYITEMSPPNEVKLGLVITHFNRKNYVIPAIQRITNEILENPFYQNKISLVVVDNSANISVEESGKAQVIANKNLGGSGGFTRGLLHLMDDGAFTHCLFMDDDASCEIESILRTYALLQYVQGDKFAIAGALLREDIPFILHEKGAIFSRGVHRALKGGMNMLHAHDVLRAQVVEQAPNYGAWWFFAFRIADVQFYPYPFFVRGDDILFGVLNGFDIFSLNGVACWGEDFWVKENPLTRYLGFRSTLVCSMLVDNISWPQLAKIYAKWFAPNLFSYNYASAKAILMAAEDVMQGPDIFLADMTASDIREKIAPLSAEEKMVPMRRADIDPDYRDGHEHKLRKILRFITLNGFLLPSFLLKQGTIFQHKHFRANFREIFRYKQVYYEYEAGHVGYVAKHDKKRFISLSWQFAISLWRYAFRYHHIRQLYRERLPEMTSLTFWRNVYTTESQGKNSKQTN